MIKVSGVSNKTTSTITSASAVAVKNPSDGACATGTCGTNSSVSGVSSTSVGSVTNGSSSSTFGSRFASDLIDRLWDDLICGSDQAYKGDEKGAVDVSGIWLKTANCSAADLAKLILVKDGKFSLDTDTLKERLRGTVYRGVVGDSSDLNEAMLRRVDAYTGSNLADGYVVVNGVRKNIAAADLDSAKGVTEFLKTMSGDEAFIEYFDLQAEFAVIDSILDKSIELGIPQAIDILADKIEDDKARRELLIRSLRSSAQSSNLDNVEKVLDLIGVDKALTNVPDLIEVMLTNYYVDPNDKESERLGQLLLSLLTRIDPIWPRLPITNYQSLGNTEELVDLRHFNIASPMAKEIFKRNGYYKYVVVSKTLIASELELSARLYV